MSSVVTKQNVLQRYCNVGPDLSKIELNTNTLVKHTLTLVTLRCNLCHGLQHEHTGPAS